MLGASLWKGNSSLTKTEGGKGPYATRGYLAKSFPRQKTFDSCSNNKGNELCELKTKCRLLVRCQTRTVWTKILLQPGGRLMCCMEHLSPVEACAGDSPTLSKTPFLPHRYPGPKGCLCPRCYTWWAPQSTSKCCRLSECWVWKVLLHQHTANVWTSR